ncbi:MAG: SxtJ family membrane protein [Bacteroidales bacterium]|jgi:energy-coupling factor transporter transmembrane protein EcfT
MEHTDIDNRKVKHRQNTETGILIAISLCILGLYTGKPYWILAAIGVLIVVLIAPALFKPFAVLWFGLSKLLGIISSGLLLTLIFYVVISPIGLIRRAMGKDSLKIRQFKKSKTSVYVIRNYQFKSSDLKFPF